MLKIKNVLINNDVIEACTKEQVKTSWKVCKLTNVTAFAVLLKEVPMGFKYAVPLEPLRKIHSVKCLTYKVIARKPRNDNLCLLRARATALHLLGKGDLRKKLKKLSHFSYRKMEELIQIVFKVFV